MKSIDRLVAEHDIIERGLFVLEKAAARIESGQPIPDDFPKWAPEFFAQFADKCHHAKEEDLFFPLLKERGIPEEGGPIGVMLHEHAVGRDCVRQMREASESDEVDGARFAAAAKEFIPLLRQHIFKENNILFQMAGNVMSEDDDADMDDKFSQVEQERGLVGMHERYHAEVARWEQETQMSNNYTHFVDVAKEVEPPDDGILTRTLFNDDDVKGVIFGFGQGEELSEHTASMPAILHIIQGEATLTLGDDTVEAEPGTWIHMAPELKHSVKTKTPVVMLLLLLKK